jgi:hypothetical protein
VDNYSGVTDISANRGNHRTGYAEWVALGAVIAGSVGALIGAARRSHIGGRQKMQMERPESSMVTAPHGDKLSAALD